MIIESKLKTLLDFTRQLTKEELIWANGYLSALINDRQITDTNGIGQPKILTQKINFVFGTETGNSKKLAGQFAAIAKKNGIVAKITAMDQYRLASLAAEEYLFIIVSTHGEGEPPEAAKKFYDYIHQEKINLENVNYSVLALGDTAYPLFCKTGADIDLQLENLNAKRFIPLQKCDVDFESDAENWFTRLTGKLQARPSSINKAVGPVKKATAGRKYYKGNVITNINLNDNGSAKETFHIEISIKEAIDYEPGDALAFVAPNKKTIVDTIISLTATDPSLVIETPKVTASVYELLSGHLNICYLFTSVIKKYAAITGYEIPDVRQDLLDLLMKFPLKSAKQFEEVIKNLLPISPRLYSISSSPFAHPNEIHLTVKRDSFFTNQEKRYGLCSGFLGTMAIDTEVKFYIHKNRAFKLPAADKDIIMIGPGTGIAPFRSFIAERDALSSSAKNWLFFGEQHFVTDFLYQSELQQYLQTGALTKIDLAFSRDKEEKIYVQHRIAEQKEEFKTWIQNGSYLYVSGSKTMGVQVEETLKTILGEQVLKTLKSEGRYQKDIY